MKQEERDKLFNTLCRLAHEIDQLQDIPFGEVEEKTILEMDFLIKPDNQET